MKRICAALICFLLISTALKDLLIYGLYISHIDYVANSFCENKESLTCKGTCYLNKILSGSTNPDQKFPALPSPAEKLNFVLQQVEHPKTVFFLKGMLRPNIPVSWKDPIPLQPPTPPPRLLLV